MSYGGDESYTLAAQWVEGCAHVEDWGCGKGYLRNFIPPERYRGVDGTSSKFSDEVADLTEYASSVEGIVLRHVLEHEHSWDRILTNALASCTQRLFIALFTPLQDKTTVLFTEPDYENVPVIGFRLEDITDRLSEMTKYTVDTILSDTAFGEETLIRVER